MDLPVETILEIAAYSNPFSLDQFCQTNKQIHNICKTHKDKIFEAWLENDFPNRRSNGTLQSSVQQYFNLLWEEVKNLLKMIVQSVEYDYGKIEPGPQFYSSGSDMFVWVLFPVQTRNENRGHNYEDDDYGYEYDDEIEDLSQQNIILLTMKNFKKSIRNNIFTWIRTDHDERLETDLIYDLFDFDVLPVTNYIGSNELHQSFGSHFDIINLDDLKDIIKTESEGNAFDFSELRNALNANELKQVFDMNELRNILEMI